MQLENSGNVEMNIDDVKEKKKKCIVTINGKKHKFFSSTIDEFNIKEGQQIDQAQLEKIISFNEKEEIIKYCLSLLSKKPYSERELKQKASKKFVNSKEVGKAIIELKKSNQLNDRYYLKKYLQYFDDNNYGRYFITNFLTNQGIKEYLVNSVSFPDYNEEIKARRYFDSIKNKYVSNNFTKQKKKIYDKMLARGFSVDIVINILNDLKVDEQKEEACLINDFKKIKSRVKKANNPKIDQDAKIVSKLINLGYSLNSINEAITKDKKGELDD